MKQRGKIITSHVRPPIPSTRWDWCAYHENEVENAHAYGWGRTEAEALSDLYRLDQERADWLEGELEPGRISTHDFTDDF